LCSQHNYSQTGIYHSSSTRPQHHDRLSLGNLCSPRRVTSLLSNFRLSFSPLLSHEDLLQSKVKSLESGHMIFPSLLTVLNWIYPWHFSRLSALLFVLSRNPQHPRFAAPFLSIRQKQAYFGIMSTGTTEDNRSKSPNGNDPQNRKKHPCVLCQQRKIKCDRNNPCQNCTKAKVECIPASALPPRRRKKRFPEAELLARLRKYEEHLKAYGADIDAINRDEAPIVPKDLPEMKHVHEPSIHSHGCARPSPDFVKPFSVRRSLRHVEK
jgi:hypothetical protein